MSALHPPAPLVWLNGWSGVGKLSVAQALQALQGSEKFILITHKPPDLAVSSHPPTPEVERTDPFVFASAQSWPPIPSTLTSSGSVSGATKTSTLCPSRFSGSGSTTTLAAISAPENRDRTILMTHRVPLDDADHIEAAREYREQAVRSGRLFLPVTVECQLVENMRRLNSEERRARRDSVVSAEEAWKVREGNRLFEFADVEHLVLNTTTMPPIDAAMELMGWINRRVDAETARLRKEMEAEDETKSREQAGNEAEGDHDEARTEEARTTMDKMGREIESDVERAKRRLEDVDREINGRGEPIGRGTV